MVRVTRDGGMVFRVYNRDGKEAIPRVLEIKEKKVIVEGDFNLNHESWTNKKKGGKGGPQARAIVAWAARNRCLPRQSV